MVSVKTCIRTNEIRTRKWFENEERSVAVPPQVHDLPASCIVDFSAVVQEMPNALIIKDISRISLPFIVWFDPPPIEIKNSKINRREDNIPQKIEAAWAWFPAWVSSFPIFAIRSSYYFIKTKSVFSKYKWFRLPVISGGLRWREGRGDQERSSWVFWNFIEEEGTSKGS